MKYLHASKGSLTLEILLASALLMLLATLSYTPSSAFLKQYHRMQVRIATQHFARDIRNLQQQALFSNNTSSSINVVDNTLGYFIKDASRNQTHTNFTDIGCEGIYFAESITSLSFSSLGAPSYTGKGTYIIKHKEDDNFACNLTVQIATGRLDINESS